MIPAQQTYWRAAVAPSLTFDASRGIDLRLEGSALKRKQKIKALAKCGCGVVRLGPELEKFSCQNRHCAVPHPDLSMRELEGALRCRGLRSLSPSLFVTGSTISARAFARFSALAVSKLSTRAASVSNCCNSRFRLFSSAA